MDWLKNVGTAADDMVRLVTNGLTFGQADRLAAALGEKDTAARTVAAHDRAGFAGDVASVAGYGGGAKALWKGAKHLPQMARAIPKIAKSPLARNAATGLGLGGAALVHSNLRQPSPAYAAAPQAAPAAAPKGGMDPGPMMPPRQAALSPFEQMVQSMAAANGGQVSMREMMAAADIANKTAPAPVKQPGFKDVMGMQANEILRSQLAEAHARADEISRTNPEAGEAYGRKATAEYMAQLAAIMGADPVAFLPQDGE